MIDETRFRGKIDPNDHVSVHRLSRSPAFYEATSEPDERGRIRSAYRGFRLDYFYATGEIQGKGSLQSFAQGSNVARFTAQEIKAACIDLASAVDLPPEQLQISRLEAGVNLPLAESPKEFLAGLMSHQKALFTATDPPSKATRPLLYNAYHTERRLKFYDKGEYNRLQGRPLSPDGPPHLLRYEIAYQRAKILQRLTGLPELTLANLYEPQVLEALANDLVKQWECTQRHQLMNYNGLSLAEATLLHVATDTAFWEAMRKTLPRSTYERNRSRAQALLQQRREPHLYDQVFARELNELLPSPEPVANVQK
ncbi:hypothetical protein [Hymenobacter sp. GOD-10R]|uniref:hypothetical protein n=1 Tax=Hymenobacter sp. GOD-10R TaxID=3093922 RepID=UPI002D77CA5C|nr:hypothetical protein [Hymenobacter sp. GOD-10R]WRQ29365.1 hypothetical protein SD425_03690 [Hymenobacter sp. GOD-10R]